MFNLQLDSSGPSKDLILSEGACIQHPNVYKQYKSHSMKSESMLFVTNHIPNLWGLSTYFSNSVIDFLQLRGCFIKLYEKEGSIKLRIHIGGWHETLNLPHASSCGLFTFCDVLHETKQKTKTNSRECAVRTGNNLWGGISGDKALVF